MPFLGRVGGSKRVATQAKTLKRKCPEEKEFVLPSQFVIYNYIDQAVGDR